MDYRGLWSAAVAAKREQWAATSLSEQARLNGRQGVRYVLQEGMTVLEPETMTEVPPTRRRSVRSCSAATS